MRNLKIYLLVFLLIFNGLTSCGKDDAVEETSKSSIIEIVVKDSSGNAKSNIAVCLFDQPSTEADGRSLAKALKKVSTNQEGIASFDLTTEASILSSGKIYFTVLEELLTGETNVLGTTEVAIQKGITEQRELTISSTALKYENGFVPTTVTSSLAIKEYNKWKSTQVVACNGALRVIADPSSQTLVEAVGFGMILAAYAKDKTTFDGIWKFYNSKRTPESKNMMGWKTTCGDILDPGSATDGDIDVAYALIVASKHWGDAYLIAAKEILQIVRDNLILECTVNGQNVLILGPGYSGIAWGGCEMMDIMYHTPAFFRVFAKVTGDNTWEKLADDTYVTLNAGAHPTTGLVPDWQTASGTPGPGGRVGYFGYDACRAPWRLTLDYLWNGNAKAKEWSTKVATWANGVGPTKIVDGFELNGTPRGTNGVNSSFLGGFAVATMARDQETVNKFGAELAKLNDNYWFNINTRCLYLFTLSGNFWNPAE